MTRALTMLKISKTFINKPVFEDMSFSFKNGCYCVVGPNGVGKTVLLDLIAGVALPDSGSITLQGVGLNTSLEFKQQLVYIPGKPLFFPSATGFDFLSFVSSTKNARSDNRKIETLISEFKLTHHMTTKFSKMSLGTQKKLFLTTLAIGNSSVLILDEPTNGLDAESNEVFYQLLDSLKKETIIVMATHDPLIVERLNPEILELSKSPTTHLEPKTTFRHVENENIL